MMGNVQAYERHCLTEEKVRLMLLAALLVEKDRS